MRIDFVMISGWSLHDSQTSVTFLIMPKNISPFDYADVAR